MVSSFRLWHPNENVTEIRIPNVKDQLEEMGLPTYNPFEQREQSLLERVVRNIYSTTIIFNHTLGTPEMESLFTSDEEFDILIMDQCYSDVMLGYVDFSNHWSRRFQFFIQLRFANHFKVPTIAFNSRSNNLLTNEMIKNRYNPAYTPGLQLKYTDHMDLGQRLANTLLGMFEMLTYK